MINGEKLSFNMDYNESDDVGHDEMSYGIDIEDIHNGNSGSVAMSHSTQEAIRNG